MAIPIARVSDSISHGGQIIGGSDNCLINGLRTARLGDPVFCQIHGLVFISSASKNLNCNDIPVARLGDSISCGATITSGSPNTFN